MKHTHTWSSACSFDDLLPESGVAALIDGRQIAIFRVGDAIYALDNYDPHSEANVLSRGLVGDINGEPVVASPVYKHHFNLATGRCVEDADYSVRAWPTRVSDGKIWIKTQPLRKTSRRKLVVIGNGMAGMKVVEELLGISGQPYDITVFGAEPVPNYNRILLSPMLAGEKHFDDIVLNPIEWYRDNGVTLHLGDPAVAIDRIRRRVRSQNGIEADYDRLLLATGSNPIVLPVPGKDLPGVVTFRDLQDVNTMLDAARTHKKAVVIGGGLLGLEAANALLKQGMQVTVVHLLETLMERQLDPVAAQLLKQSLEKRGLQFHMPAKTTAILGTDRVQRRSVRGRNHHRSGPGRHGRRHSSEHRSGSCAPACDATVACWSTTRCKRSIPACTPSANASSIETTPTAWSPRSMSKPASARLISPSMASVDIAARCCPRISKSPASICSPPATFLGGPGSEALVLRDAKRGIYKRIVLEGNKVRGAVLYGDTRDGAWYCELMSEGRDIGPLRDKLIFGEAVARRQ